MRIVYIGNFGLPDNPELMSTENDVKKAIESLGHECVAVQENLIQQNIHKIVTYDYDLLLYTGTQGFNTMPLDNWLTIIHECARRGIPTATLHLDTFWSTVRGGRRWWTEHMFHTAYLFTADGDYQKEWKLLGKNHEWLPPAVRHSAVYEGIYRDKYACDVAFVGSNGRGYHEDVWPYRKELVDNIRSMCQRNGWSFRNPGGDENKISRDDEMNDFYASATVTVGDSLCLKKESSHYWSDRVPEALGRAGFLIMPRIDALSEQGFEIPQYDWGNMQQLEGLIAKYLADGKERERIINKNFVEVAKNHTYKNRIERIIEATR